MLHALTVVCFLTCTGHVFTIFLLGTLKTMVRNPPPSLCFLTIPILVYIMRGGKNMHVTHFELLVQLLFPIC